MNSYHAFGLSIRSDLKFPELSPIKSDESTADLEIKCAESSSDFWNLEPQIEGVHFSLKLDKVGEFLIENGKQIAYLRREGVDDDILHLFLLGSCVGCILQQRGFIVLHGNAVSMDGETCKIIVGHRGAGKSTAAAWHYCQGHKILADDVCAIHFDSTGLPWVIPSYPQIKLWKVSADLLGIQTDGLRRIREGVDKFALPVGNQFAASPMRLTEVIELRAENKVSMPIEGMDKTRCLIEHSYRYPFLKKMGLTSEYAKKLITLAGKIQIRTGVRVAISAKTGTQIA